MNNQLIMSSKHFIMELKKILPFNIVCTVLPYGSPLRKEKLFFDQTTPLLSETTFA